MIIYQTKNSGIHSIKFQLGYKNVACSFLTCCDVVTTCSKKEKDWTTRVGNDRHLMCIEDPFEISHDLGRVVDRQTIRIIIEEFERAADVLQHDNDPCVTLFKPYNYGTC